MEDNETKIEKQLYVMNLECFNDKKALTHFEYHPTRQKQQQISRGVHQVLPFSVISRIRKYSKFVLVGFER